MADSNFTGQDQFDDPAPLGSIKWDEVENRLVLITPLERRDDVPNLDNTGVREVIYGRVVILDGPGSPDVIEYTPIFPRYLQGQIRPNVGTGRANLGRVGKDKSKQKPGHSVPWMLGAPSEADKAVARAFLAQHPMATPGGGGYSPRAAPSGGTPEPPF